MTYWIKLNYDRNAYIIDLERLGAFCLSKNGKITFWLPDGGFAIFLHPQSNPEAYQLVTTYLKTIAAAQNGHRNGYWVKINYERDEYVINLNCISAFSREPSGQRISFWLPDSDKQPIILHPQSNKEAYHLVQDYIKKKTGLSWD